VKRLLLLGGGHSQVEVIRRIGLQPLHHVRTTLVSPDRYTPYSGMLPGFVAGHYEFHDCHIDLERLCDSSGVEFRCSAAIGIDPTSNRVRCEDGSVFDYDALSIDIGSTPEADSVPGALDHATRVKPVAGFISVWDRIIDTARRQALRIAVVGGGAGGVELALAMHHRLRARDGAAGFHLLSDTATILPGFPARVGRIFKRVLDERGITIHIHSRIIRVGHGVLYRDTGSPLQADHIIWATAAGAPRWLAASGIQTDAHGFIAVNDALQSVSHPSVFAAGDIACMVNHARPKSGVYAVRQGPPLAENLRRALGGQLLAGYAPQKNALALISTGDKYAVASYGKFALEGKWVWHWKDRIDRRFMTKYSRPLRNSQ
jgi:selenide,water dikinase